MDEVTLKNIIYPLAFLPTKLPVLTVKIPVLPLQKSLN